MVRNIKSVFQIDPIIANDMALGNHFSKSSVAWFWSVQSRHIKYQVQVVNYFFHLKLISLTVLGKELLIDYISISAAFHPGKGVLHYKLSICG